MKMLTQESVEMFTPEMGSIVIHCTEHPQAKMDVFYDPENQTLVVLCAQCEKILVEQPIP